MIFLKFNPIFFFLFSIVNSEKMCYNHTDDQLHWRRMEENILCFTVILADDEPQILEGIRDSVEWETLGFRVIATALNGNELLEQTETLRPDLVISDIKMPFLDGLEVARILHENMMHIKIPPPYRFSRSIQACFQ